MRSQSVVFLLFAGLLLVLPVELGLAERYSEPYPAIFQPDFRGAQERDGIVTMSKPVVTLVHRSGRKREVAVETVLPASSGLSASLLDTGYGDESRANRPETRRLLHELLDKAYADDPVESVRVEWRTVKYDIASRTESTVSVDKVVRVVVGDA
jgi:hypothetical protein